MDRHVEFATHLSHLIAVYATDRVDHTAEKASLRGARSAAKHGAVDLVVVDGALRAGHTEASGSTELSLLQVLFLALGVRHVHVRHHAKQEEVKHLAGLLGSAAAGRMNPPAFQEAVREYTWSEVGIDVLTPPVPVPMPADGEAPLAAPATDHAGPPGAPSVNRPEAPATLSQPAAGEEVVAPVDGLLGNLPLPSAPPEEAHGLPLSTVLPAAVGELVGARHRELFERLITSSEPGTLRRLLEPVQAAVEQSAREGNVAESVHVLLALFACEACATDDEMRRQFVVTVRRLTKPTILRAFAMLYLDVPVCAADAEQVLARFGEDGAEAVIDRVGSAPTMQARTAYTALLGRLPGAVDALIAMLDDDREIIVERAITLMVETGHPDLERTLGEQLGHRNARVRQAAARGLGALTESSFAADALLRATEDAISDVRLAAAVGLQARREARLAARIAARLDEEPELEVQLALVVALGRIAAPEGVQKLIALSNPNERMLRRRHMPVLRLGAIEALGEARTPAAMVALQKLLEDREKDVREAAARLYTRARRQTAALGVPAVSDG
ncbi:MAG: HEAT repeat domain-containing protein [Gemmatimonadota bacterium]|nr:HEAT repeat domain-containing protein [Gemmatimonadota bacterium]